MPSCVQLGLAADADSKTAAVMASQQAICEIHDAPVPGATPASTLTDADWCAPPEGKVSRVVLSQVCRRKMRPEASLRALYYATHPQHWRRSNHLSLGVKTATESARSGI